MAEFIKNGWWINENGERVRRAAEIRRPIIRPQRKTDADIFEAMAANGPYSADEYRALYGQTE